jgi:hypothetical protein
LPRSAERHRETSNQYEGEITHEVSVMRIQDEPDGNAQFGPMGKQADNENEYVYRTRMTQMQPQGVVQTEDGHDGRADSDVVMARNKGERRDEECVHETRETACCESSGVRLRAIAHDLPRFQCDHDEEQADERPGSL